MNEKQARPADLFRYKTFALTNDGDANAGGANPSGDDDASPNGDDAIRDASRDDDPSALRW
jgi:hypothetical protein